MYLAPRDLAHKEEEKRGTETASNRESESFKYSPWTKCWPHFCGQLDKRGQYMPEEEVEE